MNSAASLRSLVAIRAKGSGVEAALKWNVAGETMPLHRLVVPAYEERSG